jgi:hypothetical protein
MADALQVGRDAFRDQAWSTAYDQLLEADEHQPLAADDLVLLGIASHLTGHDQQSLAFSERAHHEFLRIGDPASAVRCAFWLVLSLQFSGETARAGGWLAPGDRILEDHQLDFVDRG